MISFVFYTCDKRLENLYQTIRFLERNEYFLDKEIIVVYQGSGPKIPKANCFDLHLDSYYKAVMCNFGIKQAKNEIVALMDSDRILPENYFTANLDIKRNEMITTTYMLRLNQPYSDDDIINKSYDCEREDRSRQFDIGMKNLFSGNTLFYKDDYFRLGGMDESFRGYGYTDTDMTRNAISKGIDAKFLDVPELHLWHVKSVFYKDQELFDFEIQSIINLMLYSRKWSDHDLIVHRLCNNIIAKIDQYPSDLRKEFKCVYKRIYLA